MLTYRATSITDTGSDSNTYSSAVYNNTYSNVSGAYCCNTYKDSNGNTQYINYPMYYKYNPYQVITPYTWERVGEGWIYTTTGWKQFYGRPMGIKYLINVVFMKNSPFTLVAAIRQSSYTAAPTLTKITPTGLSNLATILNYKIIHAGKSDFYRIVIAGVSTSGKFGVWECGNDEYHFDMLWEDTVTYSSYDSTAEISSKGISGQGYYLFHYVSTNVLFHINNDSIKSKCVILGYDYLNDIIYRNIMTSNVKNSLVPFKSLCICAMMATNSSSSSTYGHLHCFNRLTSGSHGMESYNIALGSTSCNNIVQMYNTDTDYICSATVSNTGYIYQTTDGGQTWTQKFYGDNCYRVIYKDYETIGGSDTYFWAVGNSNSNYYRACGIRHNGDYWSSKITFPTSTAPSNRIQIPGYAFVLKNSSTVYLYNFENIMNSTDQTVSTTSLTDENNNAFTAKDAYWNKTNHTFYVSTNETNGTVLSELCVYSSDWIFRKQTINVGGPVILPKDS